MNKKKARNLRKVPNDQWFSLYIYIEARSLERTPYMRNENESQPHDWIRVATFVY